MSDNTNATYVATDADDDPTLWLRNGNYPEALISRDGLRVAMHINPFDPAAMARMDRLWDAIAATAGEAPKDDDEPTPEQVEAASAPEWARGDASNAEGDAIDALVQEVADLGWIAPSRLRDFAARVLEVGGQQPGVPVTDEMVEAKARVMYGFDWEHATSHVQNKYRAMVRASLEAKPAPVANRGAVAQAIEQAASDVDLAKYFLPGTTDRFVDALLAADVFRDEATVKAEALEEEAARTYRDGGYDYPFAASDIAAFLKARATALRAGTS